MSDTSMPKSIAIGLAKAQVHARGVAKNGRNNSGKYNYATSEDIIAEGRIALLEGGRLAFSVIGWTFDPPAEQREAKTREKDGETKVLAQAIGRIKVRYMLTHLSEGDVFEAETSAPVVPEWGRPDDKAEYGALTECHAYTLRGLLNLPRGVDGAVDMNQRPDEAPLPGDEAPAAEQTPPPPTRAASLPSAARSAADAAVSAQVRGPTGAAAPSVDPAHEALARDLGRKARDVNLDPATTFEEIMAAGLPKALRDRVAVTLLESVFRGVGSFEMYDGWVGLLADLKLPDPSPERDRMVAACGAAEERLTREQGQAA